MKTPAYGWFSTTTTTELCTWRGEAQKEMEFRGEHPLDTTPATPKRIQAALGRLACGHLMIG